MSDELFAHVIRGEYDAAKSLVTRDNVNSILNVESTHRTENYIKTITNAAKLYTGYTMMLIAIKNWFKYPSADERDHAIAFIKFLLEHGADVNMKTTRPYLTRPIHYAIGIATAGNNDLLFRTLLDAGADVNKQVDYKNTALHIVVTKYFYEESLKYYYKLLTKYGANTDLKNIYGKTPRQVAIQIDNRSAVRIIPPPGPTGPRRSVTRRAKTTSPRSASRRSGSLRSGSGSGSSASSNSNSAPRRSRRGTPSHPYQG